MKNLIIIMAVFALVLCGCHEKTIGYLQIKNAEYVPNTLEIRRTLDPSRTPDKNMINSGANWVSSEISGVLGTNPLIYSIEDVKVENGGDAELFKEQAWIIGGGRVYFPSKNIKTPNGTYILSIRVSNEGYSAVLEDILRVVITDN